MRQDNHFPSFFVGKKKKLRNDGPLLSLKPQQAMIVLEADARLQAGTGRRNGLSILSLLSLKKKNKRAKNNPLVLLFIFCFLRFLYNRLFPIVFSILAFSNYIGFF